MKFLSEIIVGETDKEGLLIIYDKYFELIEEFSKEFTDDILIEIIDTLEEIV